MHQPSRRWDSSESFSREVDAMRLRIAELRAVADSGDANGHADVLLGELETAHEELRVADEEVRAQQEELTRLVEGQTHARAMRERFIAMLAAPVLVTDAAGLIHTANAAAAALLGLRVDRLLGKPLFSFVAPEDRAGLRKLLASSVAEGRTELEMRLSVVPRGSDEPVPLEVAASLPPDGLHRATAVTWVLLDDTPIGSAHRGEAFSGGRLAHALVDLTQAAMTPAPTAEVLSAMAATCQGAFTTAVFVSINVGDPASPNLVATSSKLAQNLDGVQILAGDGPSHECWTARRTVTSNDLHHDERWPRLAHRLGQSPVTSVISAPIELADELVGTLNVYSFSTELVDEAALETVELLTGAVAAVLHEANVKQELRTVAAQLEKALQSRAVIDQAKGILMARHRCDADEAFRLLARASSSANVKLREIAERLVAETVVGPLGTGHAR